MKNTNCPLIVVAKLPGSALPFQSTRTVLMALADMASQKNGFTAWPSRKYLENRTGLSRATITRATSTLAKLGLIEIQNQFRDGMQIANRYRLCITAINALIASIGGGLTVIGRGAHHAAQKVKEKIKKQFRPSEIAKTGQSTRDRSLHDDLTDNFLNPGTPIYSPIPTHEALENLGHLQKLLKQ